MKKIFLVICFMLFTVVFASCNKTDKLYVLSWGGYINEDLVAKFEEEFGVKVEISEATSNELMYNQIKNRAAQYDIAIPSDYMIHRMYLDNMLIPLNFSKLPNYNRSNIDPILQDLRDNYFEANQDYSIPYFWGTLGIMYNKEKTGVKELVENNGWKVFFEESIIPSGVTVGMYDSSRDAVAAAELYKGYSLNTKDLTQLQEVENLLKGFNYDRWGTDDLKTDISTQNLDIALVYSGDFIDTWYYTLDTGNEVTFDMFVPENNNVWFDAMVIPTTSKKIDLAHEFINFFINEENAYENASYVGYCPTMKSVYDELLLDPEMEEFVTHPGFYPGNITNGEIYENLGEQIALRMDEILTRAKID